MGNGVYRNELGIVSPKKRHEKKPLDYEIIRLGEIAFVLKSHWSVFIDLLTITKNDFNWYVFYFSCVLIFWTKIFIITILIRVQ